MKRLMTLALCLSVILFTSCDNNAGNNEQTQPVPATATSNPLLPPPSIDTSNKGVQVANNTGQVALNPAHGQPGHRCDIAVGAPLNSPSNTTTQNTNPTIVNPINNAAAKTTVPPPATTTTAAGLNPAHGQPGHRCDIAVGAPLNSAPTTATQNTNPTTVTPNNNAAAKITVPPPATTTATAKGLNPAHGQPGHRCDIAVGAPLNSKPAN